MISAYNVAIGVQQRQYPYEAVIRSGLDIADEFCIAYDRRFDNPEIFTAIDSRVRPIEVEIDFLKWDFICEVLTTARRECKGNWCLYLEMDEVLHEKDTDTILKAVEVAEVNGHEAVNIKYLDMYQNYVIPRFFFDKGNYRQKITINLPSIYHKTCDYMIERMDSPVWDGKFIKSGYDDVAYYDERTNRWFRDSIVFFPNDHYRNPKMPIQEDIEYNTNNCTYVWHYANYNHSRKMGQWRQNKIWQDRVYGRTNELDAKMLEELLKEHVVIDTIEAQRGIEEVIARGAMTVNLNHPKYVSDWLVNMTL